jgi:alkylation response protein AidB-like acyl-CoA dehydrogenase
MTVDYARDRHQFGVPVGSFQAVKHHCANMLMQTEVAHAAAYYAAWAHQAEPGEFPTAALLAAACCADAYVEVAETAIQVHGGIGYTWEHDAHLFLKRAKASQLLFGGSDHVRNLLADRLGY